jgi:uncharacterized membrane protein
VKLPLSATRWAWLTLIGLQLVWFAGLGPEPPLGRAASSLLAVVPMLLPLWWIWRLRVNGLVVGGMLLLIYFCVAVAEAWVDPVARPVALLQIAVIVVYFIALAGVRRGATRRAAGDPD